MWTVLAIERGKATMWAISGRHQKPCSPWGPASMSLKKAISFPASFLSFYFYTKAGIAGYREHNKMLLANRKRCLQV